jgi:hypothetical protein
VNGKLKAATWRTAVYRAALEERKRERSPLDWATTAGNLGLTLLELADRNKNLKTAQEASRMLRGALDVLGIRSKVSVASKFRDGIARSRMLCQTL